MAVPRTLLDLGAHGGAHWIKDLDDLAQWLSDERGKWQWLQQLQESYQNWGRVDGQFNRFAQFVQDARNQGQPVHVLVADVAAQFLPGGQQIHSSSAEGEAILSVAHSVGYAEAAFAFAMMKHWVSIQAMPAQLSFFHGLIRVAMPGLEPVATVGARLH